MIQLIVVCLATFLGAVALGSIPFLSPAKGFMSKLENMTALAAGFLIGAAMLVAIPEGIEMLADATVPGESIEVFSVGIALTIGFLFMMILEAFGFGHDIHEEHHDHSHEHGHDHVNHPTRSSALPAILGLTIHAFIDGMVIGVAMAQESLGLTVTMVLVIMMHKFPAAFSVSAFSLHERGSRARSKIDLLIFAAATPVAIILFRFLFLDVSSTIRGLAILFSAGTFLYIATVDVLPAMHVRSRSRKVAGLVAGGAMTILVISSSLHVLLPDIH